MSETHLMMNLGAAVFCGVMAMVNGMILVMQWDEMGRLRSALGMGCVVGFTLMAWKFGSVAV